MKSILPEGPPANHELGEVISCNTRFRMKPRGPIEERQGKETKQRLKMAIK